MQPAMFELKPFKAPVTILTYQTGRVCFITSEISFLNFMEKLSKTFY